jgi:hypothetical protein
MDRQAITEGLDWPWLLDGLIFFIGAALIGGVITLGSMLWTYIKERWL